MRPDTRTTLLVAAMLFALSCESPPPPELKSPIADAIKSKGSDPNATFDHRPLDRLLRGHVRGARVDYRGLKTAESDLDNYLETLGTARLEQLPRGEKKALLINAYNAFTLKLILERYPDLKSIKDIDSPWKEKRWEIGGDTVSLDNIEHGLLRAIFKDPRIHFAVNCASIGCPPLQPWAFTGERVETQLDDAARAFASNPRYVRLSDSGLELSKILQWYSGDFTAKDYNPRAESVPLFIARYTPPEITKRIEADPDISVDYLDYDWTLNDAQ